MKKTENIGYYAMHWFFLFALPTVVFLGVHGLKEFTSPGLAIGCAAFVFVIYALAGIDLELFVSGKKSDICPHCGKGLVEEPEEL